MIEPYLVRLPGFCESGRSTCPIFNSQFSKPFTFKDHLFQQIVYFFFLAWELQDLLNRVVKKSYEMDDVFHLETCRALVALSDEDKSGRLNFDEFKQIWLGVRSWIETFLKFDQGTFNNVGFRHNFSIGVIH